MAKKGKSAAILTLKRVPDMSDAGRKAIAAWLKRQALMLVKDGKNYSETRFIARYMYR